MEEEQKVSPDMKKGFNHGYWLQRGDSRELQKTNSEAANYPDYKAGLKAGEKEAQREKFHEQIKDAENSQQQNKDHGIELD